MSDPSDTLYRAHPREFIAARTALAKTLKGEAAARVKALAKPTVPAWAVNQLYWRDRPTFERLTAAGAALRRAELAALKGHAADLRSATAAHRAALGEAIRRTIALARSQGVEIDSGTISGTLEAMSVAPAGVEPGRLTKPLRPSGFEALAGVPIAAPAHASPLRFVARATEPPSAPGKPEEDHRPDAARRAAEQHEAAARRAAEKREAAARRAADKREAARRRALDRAIAIAERDEERARRQLTEAQKKLAELRLRRG